MSATKIKLKMLLRSQGRGLTETPPMRIWWIWMFVMRGLFLTYRQETLSANMPPRRGPPMDDMANTAPNIPIRVGRWSMVVTSSTFSSEVTSEMLKFHLCDNCHNGHPQPGGANARHSTAEDEKFDGWSDGAEETSQLEYCDWVEKDRLRCCYR